MENALEIIIPARKPGKELEATVASLAAQTDRSFCVLLSGNVASDGDGKLEAAEMQLAAAGVEVRRVKSPAPLRRVEHWNWSCAQARAKWLKLLLPGEQLKPTYVERISRRIREKPQARFIRCDAEVATDWGPETLRAPFSQSNAGPAQVAQYFPAHIDWLSRSSGCAWDRTAWLAMGGFLPQLPALAVLNLNVMMALHYGVENVPETLAIGAPMGTDALNENGTGRVNPTLELWMILRQARNYCKAAKLPWAGRCLLWRAWIGARGRF